VGFAVCEHRLDSVNLVCRGRFDGGIRNPCRRFSHHIGRRLGLRGGPSQPCIARELEEIKHSVNFHAYCIEHAFTAPGEQRPLPPSQMLGRISSRKYMGYSKSNMPARRNVGGPRKAFLREQRARLSRRLPRQAGLGAGGLRFQPPTHSCGMIVITISRAYSTVAHAAGEMAQRHPLCTRPRPHGHKYLRIASCG